MKQKHTVCCVNIASEEFRDVTNFNTDDFSKAHDLTENLPVIAHGVGHGKIMTPKIIAIVVNCFCFMSILIPMVKESSMQGRASLQIFGIVLEIVFIYGSAIINLVFATRSRTQAACALNSLSAVVFASWFWLINNDIHNLPMLKVR